MLATPIRLRNWISVQAQRDQVSLAEADAAFDNGEFKAAAALYGRIAKGPPSFEEVALKLVEAGASDALQTFLQTRLENLSSDDKVQVGPHAGFAHPDKQIPV